MIANAFAGGERFTLAGRGNDSDCSIHPFLSLAIWVCDADRLSRHAPTDLEHCHDSLGIALLAKNAVFGTLAQVNAALVAIQSIVIHVKLVQAVLTAVPDWSDSLTLAARILLPLLGGACLLQYLLESFTGGRGCTAAKTTCWLPRTSGPLRNEFSYRVNSGSLTSSPPRVAES